MTASLNKTQIIGNLGQDPEVRFTPGGKAVANVSVATTEKWKDKETGELKDKTEWHRVKLFGSQAEVAGEYLKKGSKVYIEGRLETSKYTDKAGVERYTTEIVASDMKMLDGRKEPEHKVAAPRPEISARQVRENAAKAMDPEDIPF